MARQNPATYGRISSPSKTFAVSFEPCVILTFATRMMPGIFLSRSLGPSSSAFTKSAERTTCSGNSEKDARLPLAHDQSKEGISGDSRKGRLTDFPPVPQCFPSYFASSLFPPLFPRFSPFSPGRPESWENRLSDRVQPHFCPRRAVLCRESIDGEGTRRARQMSRERNLFMNRRSNGCTAVDSTTRETYEIDRSYRWRCL